MTDDTYRYKYTGRAPAIFPELTAHGHGELHKGDEIEAPVVLVHADLEPLGPKTLKAVKAVAAGEPVPKPKPHKRADRHSERSGLADPGLDEVETAPAAGGMVSAPVGAVIGDGDVEAVVPWESVEHFPGGPATAPDDTED